MFSQPRVIRRVRPWHKGAFALLIAAGFFGTAAALALGSHSSKHFGLAPVRPLGTVPPLASPPPSVGPAPIQPVASALPTGLRIADAGVNSGLKAVYTQPDGTLDVPVDIGMPGWWAQGALPGDVGPAVIVGHVDSYVGPGVFFRVRSMKPGQLVEVSRADGSTVVYAIDGIREFAKDKFPTALVYGRTPTAVLRLVTCGGAFDRSTGHYLDNVVAFGHLVRITKPAQAAL